MKNKSACNDKALKWDDVWVGIRISLVACFMLSIALAVLLPALGQISNVYAGPLTSYEKSKSVKQKIQQKNRELEAKLRELKAESRKLDREEGKLKFGKSTEYFKGNYRYIQGVIHNNGKRRREFVKVTIKFYDSRKKLLRIESAYTDPTHIPPGGTASYTIMIDKSVPADTYGTSMRAKIGD